MECKSWRVSFLEKLGLWRGGKEDLGK